MKNVVTIEDFMGFPVTDDYIKVKEYQLSYIFNLKNDLLMSTYFLLGDIFILKKEELSGRVYYSVRKYPHSLLV